MVKGEDDFLVVVNHDTNKNIEVKATGNMNLYRLNRRATQLKLSKNTRVMLRRYVHFFWKD
ncbi:MAG TPA: hypothetical protein DDX07_07470 [Porphyromonadaceae bacterium]|nr:hypothetical protein [Porphyromonadaceae bacterium]